MALFFLLVGLEIKREMIDGQLATWSRRALPGIAAAGGMLVPAIIYTAFNLHNPETLRGWAIPTATDIAFALGVISLLGKRVPASLKIFLAALAIIDDLGAVIIIALFYSTGISLPELVGAILVLVVLFGLNRRGVLQLWPYLLLGVALWVLVYRSGVHATLAGVGLALTIPLRMKAGAADDVFLGVAGGLVAGKLIGVFGSAAIVIRLGFADLPVQATWTQLFGTALLCGIGFTMSLFIGLLAFAGDPVLQEEVKLGILCGSTLAAVLGTLVLMSASRRSA